jgi:hypothetical protein
MSRVDRKAVEPLIFGIDASGIPVESRLRSGISTVGDGKMIPRYFISKTFPEWTRVAK